MKYASLNINYLYLYKKRLVLFKFVFKIFITQLTHIIIHTLQSNEYVGTAKGTS